MGKVHSKKPVAGMKVTKKMHLKVHKQKVAGKIVVKGTRPAKHSKVTKKASGAKKVKLIKRLNAAKKNVKDAKKKISVAKATQKVVLHAKLILRKPRKSPTRSRSKLKSLRSL